MVKKKQFEDKPKCKVNVTFEFEVDRKKSNKEIKDCIAEQILSDMNVYFQNDDDTAQLTKIKIKE